MGGGCIGWSGFELGNCADNTDKGVLMESLMSIALNMFSSPHRKGRYDT